MEPAARPEGEMLGGRFRLGRCLGQGAFGVVHEAHDSVRGTRVALKRLSRFDPSALYRFKQEFRALADVHHPNLVTLHELFADGDAWYLTMELVEGTDLLSWVRPGPAGARVVAGRSETRTAPTAAEAPRASTVALGPTDDPGPLLARSRERGAGTELSETRLRPALAQLAAAVSALHAAGKLHRDLKPSNVLVRADGRVIVLDFGLVATLAPTGTHLSIDQGVVGTPAYMAPEQAAGQAVTPAADWYAFGAILFEALTGQLPFGGSPLEVLADKLARDPPDPQALAPEAPPELCALARALLRRAPWDRPGGAEVLAALGPPDERSSSVEPPARPRAVAGLVGREEHRRVLAEALRETRQGHATVVLLQGTSGMGKSALLRSFLDELADGAEQPAATARRAVVLEGRCFERESVPYKAFDSVVDALTERLRAMTPEEAERVMPRHLPALARVFPVMRRFERGAGSRSAASEGTDPRELRRRAFAALRELLGRLAERDPVVVAIDDLQWGDADSGELLVELMRPPDAPALLLVAAFRGEDRERSPLLRALHAARAQGELGPRALELEVGALARDDARALAASLLARPNEAAITAIADESGGSPFFVHELVRWVESSRDESASRATGGTGLSLASVSGERVARLPDAARELLCVVAVAGHPLATAVALETAGLGGGDEGGVVAELRAAHLLRTRTGKTGEELETLHDRIRETVAAGLDAAAIRAIHARLASVLESAAEPDAETLLWHLGAAGEPHRARAYAEQAADRAAFALAFDRAADLYVQAIELTPPDAVPLALRTKLASTLAAAGRGPEAGRAFLLAAGRAAGDEALDLRWRGAEQLFRSGHFDDALAAVETVLDAVGLSLPRTPARALLGLLFERLRLRLRGLEHTERDARELPAHLLRRMDVTYAVGTGLSPADMVRGTVLLTRHLRWALDAGEPLRIARGLSAEACFTALTGSSPARASMLAGRARAIAERIGNPYALGYAAAAEALSVFCDFRWRATVERCDEAIRIFREQCEGHSAWEEGSLDYCALRALAFEGAFAEIERRGPRCAKEAAARGDLFTATMLRVYILPWPHLAADRPEEARREADEGIAAWTRRDFHVQHCMHGYIRGSIELYEGQAEAALARVLELVPRILAARLHRGPHVGVFMHHLRARAALAVAARRGPERTRLLGLALRDARVLARDGRPYPLGCGLLARAAAAHLQGDGVGARALLDEAEHVFVRGEMTAYAAAARRRRGELAGSAGGGLIREADRTLRGLGVHNPRAMTECFASGFAPAPALAAPAVAAGDTPSRPARG